MIRYTHGHLLKAPPEALVNTVNEIGVMGKGIALMFRETFPETARSYERAAKAGQVRVGRCSLRRIEISSEALGGLFTFRRRSIGDIRPSSNGSETAFGTSFVSSANARLALMRYRRSGAGAAAEELPSVDF